MNIKRFTVGLLRTNCYIVSSDSDAVIIDPGLRSKYEIDDVSNYVNENSLRVRGIIITHAHIDHVIGVDILSELFHCPVYVSSDDKNSFYDPDTNLSTVIMKRAFVPACGVITFNDGDTLSISSINFKCVLTPGHTQGSVCLFCGNTVFTGDTLFNLSAGRTDLAGGSDIQLKDSLEKLKNLIKDENYRIFPGHGSETTARFELENNEYFK